MACSSTRRWARRRCVKPRRSPAYVTALERQEGKGAFERLVAETARHEATLRANGRRLFHNFARLLKTGDTNLQMP